jgi:hypothetical protein
LRVPRSNRPSVEFSSSEGGEVSTIQPRTENPKRFCAFRMLSEYRRLVRFPEANKYLKGSQEYTLAWLREVLPELPQLKKCTTMDGALKLLKVEFAKRGLKDDAYIDYLDEQQSMEDHHDQIEIDYEFINELDPGRDD